MGNYNPTLDQIQKLDSFQLFDFDYGIGGTWKDELEYFLKERFYDYEIAPDLTIDSFKRKWKFKLITIMPYYIKLKETVINEYDPTFSISNTETFTKTRSGSASSQRDNTGTKKDQASGTDYYTETDYPATGDLLSDIPSQNKSVEHGLLNTRTDALVEKLAGSDQEQETSTRSKTGSGNRTAVQLMMEYRESLLRINAMIASELKPLFRLHY